MQIVSTYSTDLVAAISAMFQLAITENHSELQEETLVLLSCMAESLKDLFTQHYG